MKINNVRNVNAKIGAVSIGVAIVLCSPTWAFAQEAEDADIIEEIIVTGSRLKRTLRDASVPVAAVDAEDFVLSGTANVEDLLNSMPQFVAGTTGASNGLSSPTGVLTS